MHVLVQIVGAFQPKWLQPLLPLIGAAILSVGTALSSMVGRTSAVAGTASASASDVLGIAALPAIVGEWRRCTCLQSPLPVCWLGFEKKNWTGAQLIGFKGEGLKLAFQVANDRVNKRQVFRHLDCLWIQQLCDHIFWPHRSLATQLDHWSATANFERKGQHKRIILGSESEGPRKRL